MEWRFDYSLEAEGAELERAWELLERPERWPEWDVHIRRAWGDSPLRPGSTVRIDFARPGPALRFRVVEYERGRLMTDETRLPGARMGHRHRVSATERGIRFDNTIYVAGPLARVWGALVGRDARKGLPEAIRRLAELSRTARA